MKPRLFQFGGCDLYDITRIDLLQRNYDVISYAPDPKSVDNGLVGFEQASFPDVGTSVISLYTKPGALAQRCLESLQKAKKRDMILNRRVFNEVAKFPYLEFYRRHVRPGDFLVLGFSPELYTKIQVAGECFSCVPGIDVIKDPNNCLHWLYQDYVRMEKYQLPFDTKASLEWSFDLLVDFARDIHQLFQERVILVKTHFSSLLLTRDLRVEPVKIGPDQLSYYRQTKLQHDPTDNRYAERLSTIIMNKFQHHYSSTLTQVQLTQPPLIDANHDWGLNPFHIDPQSRYQLAVMIDREIQSRMKPKEQGP